MNTVKDSDPQEQQVKALAWALDRIFDFNPCQTPGCENTTDEHPTACTMCADREAEHGN